MLATYDIIIHEFIGPTSSNKLSFVPTAKELITCEKLDGWQLSGRIATRAACRTLPTVAYLRGGAHWAMPLKIFWRQNVVLKGAQQENLVI